MEIKTVKKHLDIENSMTEETSTEVSSSKESDSGVLVQILEAKQGNIGLLTLNAEKTLNSLTLDMVRVLSETLTAWEKDQSISVIVLMGQGDKAFCAGGDVQALYQSAIHPKDGVCVDAETFFLNEYQLNYQIHCYDKPIICFGNGYVMGGGLGLLAGASHRVVTETTQIAMPEITIGLFPDVGATHFLNQIPFNIGYFLALTGARVNGNDAIFCKLANYSIERKNINTCIDELQKSTWKEDSEGNHQIVDEVLSLRTPQDSNIFPVSNITENLEVLERVCQQNSLCDTLSAIYQIDEDSKWLKHAKFTLAAGSPLSSLLIYEQLRRHRYADLQTIFKSELTLATNIIRYPEFSEGVRALLIDKDKQPKWQFEHYSHVPNSLIDKFFTQPWDVNPLDNYLN